MERAINFLAGDVARAQERRAETPRERMIELAADKETARRSAGFLGFDECRDLLDKGWTIDLFAGQNGGATYSKPKGKKP